MIFKTAISIDFDGTIVESDYPDIIGMKPHAKEIINRLYEDFVIVINTCRAGDFAKMAEDWLKENGVKYHFFNENDPARIEAYNTDTRKISADLYIDDKQVGGLPDDWYDIYVLILPQLLEIERKRFLLLKNKSLSK